MSLKAGVLVLTHNLPAQATPFLGRQDELRQIADLLSDPACRLLTLIGPGGIGKTRLALEVANLVAADYPDGVNFVALQSLCEPDSIVPTIAENVDFPFFFGTDPAEQLYQYLEPKTMLLVLDNFEHLLDGAVLVSDLLGRAPGVKVVVTSRERLNLREEWLLEVGGLRFPIEGDQMDQETYSAVQLFAQNARRVRPAFSLAMESSAVVRICALVGGMPLALELASSWVRALSCAEIADELQRGLDILETSARNVPERHRDMRAVLDHSWWLLTEDERLIMMKLSVFQDGFTRDAARQVTGASPRILSALVDKSWLRWKAERGRYDIHELLRQYSQGKLNDSGEAETIRHAHMRYFAAFMREREEGIKFGQQIESLADIERDFENTRLAWRWAVQNRDTEALNQMAEALNLFSDMKARWAEGEELFRSAENTFIRPGTPTEEFTLARMFSRRVRMIALGMMKSEDELRPFRWRMEDGIKIARAYGDMAETGFQLFVTGMLNETFMSAIRYFEDSFIIYSELNDPFYMAETLAWLDVTHHNHKVNRGFLLHCLDLQRQIGDLNGMGWTLIHLSGIAYFDRDYAAMEQYIQEATVHQRARVDKKGLYWSQLMSAQWGMAMGDFERGLALSEAAMQIANNLNMPTIRLGALATLGLMLIVTERDYAAGARMCAEATTVVVPYGFNMGEAHVNASMGLMIAAYHAGDLEKARQHYNHFVDYLASDQNDKQMNFYLLAPPAALLLTGNGQYTEAVELLSAVFHLPQVPGSPQIGWLHKAPLIIRTQEELCQRLGEAVYEAAWERGKALDSNTLIGGLMGHFESSAGVQTIQPSSSASSADNPLTERELEVLALVAAGLSNREIAERLVLALGTVKWYISEVYSKLGVTSRTQAVAYARERQLIS
jgi:predicted ATPase/DNA-binding CsgD family transcriptional regulator